MVADDATTPSEKALAILRERIEGDGTIDAAAKEAVLADLTSANPSAFKNLTAVLAEIGQDDETKKTESE